MLALVAVAAAIALFYGEENWRGRRAWKAYEKELASRGEPTSPAQLIPPPVPDDQNFAMTPFLAPLSQFEQGTQKWRDTNAVARIQAFPVGFNQPSGDKHAKAPRLNSWLARPVDLQGWDLSLKQGTNSVKDTQTRLVANNLTTAEAATGVLASLSQYDPVIEELRLASRRPYARFNLAYDFPDPAAILLPHLAFVKRTSQVLQVRACAELAAGKTDQAFADMDLMFYLANCIRQEPILISHLVRIAESQLILQPLAQGLASHQWSDAQLAAFEEQLAKFDFCADGRRTLEGERVLLGGAFIDYIRNSPNRFRVINSLGGFPEQQDSGFESVAFIYAVAPKGWLDFEKRNYHRAFEDFMLPVFDPSARKIDPRLAEQGGKKFEALVKKRGPGTFFQHRFFIGLLMPALSRAVQRTAYGQAAVDEAAVACALERYRLANGAYPDSLDVLAPKSIAVVPHDVILGRPLKYHRTDDGQYVLYSVGWNAKDDGGVLALNKSGEGVDVQQGDWVWKPAASPGPAN